jgi:hypothetical protein
MSELDSKTYLFTLRVWAGQIQGNRVSWRGKLQALPDGEAYYFQGWKALVERLDSMLASTGSASDQTISDDKGE